MLKNSLNEALFDQSLRILMVKQILGSDIRYSASTCINSIQIE
jgi:hypothetical protein